MFCAAAPTAVPPADPGEADADADAARPEPSHGTGPLKVHGRYRRTSLPSLLYPVPLQGGQGDSALPVFLRSVASLHATLASPQVGRRRGVPRRMVRGGPMGKFGNLLKVRRSKLGGPGPPRRRPCTWFATVSRLASHLSQLLRLWVWGRKRTCRFSRWMFGPILFHHTANSCAGFVHAQFERGLFRGPSTLASGVPTTSSTSYRRQRRFGRIAAPPWRWPA